MVLARYSKASHIVIPVLDVTSSLKDLRPPTTESLISERLSHIVINRLSNTVKPLYSTTSIDRPLPYNDRFISVPIH